MRLASFLLTYFDFAYYLFQCPFRFSKNTSKNGGTSRYKISTCPLRQFFWLLLSFLGNVLLRGTKIWHSFGELRSAPQNPKLYFTFVSDNFSLISEVVLQYVVWFRQHDLLEIVNYLAENSKQLLNPRRFQLLSKLFLYGICVLPTYLASQQFLFRYMYHSAPNYGSYSHTWYWSDSYIQKYQYDFDLFRTKPSNLSTACWSGDNPSTILYDIKCFSVNVLFGFLLILGKFNRDFTSCYIDLFILMHVITAWRVVACFTRALKEDRDLPKSALASSHNLEQNPLLDKGVLGGRFVSVNLPSRDSCRQKLSWLQVKDMYFVVEGFCDRINKSLATLMTFFIGGSILYHSINFDKIVSVGDLRQLYFLGLAAAVFLFSADVVQQMNVLYNWMELAENRTIIPDQDYKLIISHLKRTRVGIKAGNIVTITYGVLWNSLVTVVTYFIICLQTRSD